MKPNSSSSATPPPSGRLHKTLAGASNLANLLPSGTVFVFQTLVPSFSNKGDCHVSNKYLTAALIAFCSAVCFLSSFTDSFVDSDGKLYYGIATRKGLWVLNGGDGENGGADLSRLRVRWIDFVHAWAALLVFLALAFCEAKVQRCFFPSGAADLDVLVVNLPLAAGVLSTFFFTIFPTTRRGIGYSEMPGAVK